MSVLVLAACVSAPPRSAAERAADADTATRIEQALNADPTLFARHIDVEVERGVAHLSGFVWSEGDFLRARTLAARVSGVSAVDEEMELVRGGARGR